MKKFLLLFIFFSDTLLSQEKLFQDVLTREVGIKTLVFHDSQRERILITEIYHPNHTPSQGKSTKDLFDRNLAAKEIPFLEGKNKLPLILFSHGYKGDRFTLSWLQETLASYGYITASVDHFSSTWYLQDPEEAMKRWERPLDIQFVLTSLLNDPLFGPHIDSERIGFIGYNLGGLTGIWLAGGVANLYRKPKLYDSASFELDEGTTDLMLSEIDFNKGKENFKDPRIKAEVLFSPVYGFAFDKEGLSPIQIPILIIAGDQDPARPKENAIHFAKWIPKASLSLLEGVNTSLFVNERIRLKEKNIPENFRNLHREIVKKILQFFSTALPSERVQKAPQLENTLP